MKKKYSAGDTVYVDCDSSFGSSSCGFEKVEEAHVRYDEMTGAPYEVYKVGSSWYDQRTGACVKGAWAYYLRDPDEMHS
jgi:hypothetical protein